MSGRTTQIARGALAAGVLAAGAIGLEATVRPAEAIGFPVACPHVYAPVICDGDEIYSNQCFADAAGATGCEPWFPGWIVASL